MCWNASKVDHTFQHCSSNIISYVFEWWKSRSHDVTSFWCRESQWVGLGQSHGKDPETAHLPQTHPKVCHPKVPLPYALGYHGNLIQRVGFLWCCLEKGILDRLGVWVGGGCITWLGTDQINSTQSEQGGIRSLPLSHNVVHSSTAHHTPIIPCATPPHPTPPHPTPPPPPAHWEPQSHMAKVFLYPLCFLSSSLLSVNFFKRYCEDNTFYLVSYFCEATIHCIAYKVAK